MARGDIDERVAFSYVDRPDAFGRQSRFAQDTSFDFIGAHLIFRADTQPEPRHIRLGPRPGGFNGRRFGNRWHFSFWTPTRTFV